MSSMENKTFTYEGRVFTPEGKDTFVCTEGDKKVKIIQGPDGTYRIARFWKGLSVKGNKYLRDLKDMPLSAALVYFLDEREPEVISTVGPHVKIGDTVFTERGYNSGYFAKKEERAVIVFIDDDHLADVHLFWRNRIIKTMDTLGIDVDQAFAMANQFLCDAAPIDPKRVCLHESYDLLDYEKVTWHEEPLAKTLSKTMYAVEWNPTTWRRELYQRKGDAPLYESEDDAIKCAMSLKDMYGGNPTVRKVRATVELLD